MVVFEMQKGSIKLGKSKEQNYIIRCAKRININPGESFEYNTKVVCRCSKNEKCEMKLCEKFKNCLSFEKTNETEIESVLLNLTNTSNELLRLTINDELVEVFITNNILEEPEQKEEEPEQKEEEPEQKEEEPEQKEEEPEQKEE